MGLRNRDIEYECGRGMFSKIQYKHGRKTIMNRFDRMYIDEYYPSKIEVEFQWPLRMLKKSIVMAESCDYRRIRYRHTPSHIGIFTKRWLKNYFQLQVSREINKEVFS